MFLETFRNIAVTINHLIICFDDTIHIKTANEMIHYTIHPVLF